MVKVAPLTCSRWLSGRLCCSLPLLLGLLLALLGFGILSRSSVCVFLRLAVLPGLLVLLTLLLNRSLAASLVLLALDRLLPLTLVLPRSFFFELLSTLLLCQLLPRLLNRSPPPPPPVSAAPAALPIRCASRVRSALSLTSWCFARRAVECVHVQLLLHGRLLVQRAFEVLVVVDEHLPEVFDRTDAKDCRR